jgi:hypothetical protein
MFSRRSRIFVIVLLSPMVGNILAAPATQDLTGPVTITSPKAGPGMLGGAPRRGLPTLETSAAPRAGAAGPAKKMRKPEDIYVDKLLAATEGLTQDEAIAKEASKEISKDTTVPAGDKKAATSLLQNNSLSTDADERSFIASLRTKFSSATASKLAVDVREARAKVAAAIKSKFQGLQKKMAKISKRKLSARETNAVIQSSPEDLIKALDKEQLSKKQQNLLDAIIQQVQKEEAAVSAGEPGPTSTIELVMPEEGVVAGEEVPAPMATDVPPAPPLPPAQQAAKKVYAPKPSGMSQEDLENKAAREARAAAMGEVVNKFRVQRAIEAEEEAAGEEE